MYVNKVEKGKLVIIITIMFFIDFVVNKFGFLSL
jgi:hypothetical protein